MIIGKQDFDPRLNPYFHYVKLMNAIFLLENLKERDHSKYLDVEEKIILERILGKEVGNFGLDLSGSV